MCKKFKFDHANKCYMRNPAAVLENDTHKLLWDFDIQTDHLISARRPDLIIINKKKRKFAKLSTLLFRLTTEYNWKNVKRDLVRELKKLWNMKVTIIPIVIGLYQLWRTSGDHPNYYIIENGQNTEKSPGDLRRLAVTQTPVKNHQLTLIWKTLTE